MLKFRSFLSEAPVGLRPAELAKPNSKTKEPRIDILMRAAIEGIPLVLTSNKEVQIANTPENREAIAAFDGKKPIELTTTTGKTISSSEIGKKIGRAHV